MENLVDEGGGVTIGENNILTKRYEELVLCPRLSFFPKN